jgi:hypothetical protein
MHLAASFDGEVRHPVDIVADALHGGPKATGP